MTRVFMTHRVNDYDAWRAVYDDDAPARLSAAGLTHVGHYHSTADRNVFIVVWESSAEADSVRTTMADMLADPELGATMQAAGVIEPPEYWVA
jgi:hypothetical protein